MTAVIGIAVSEIDAVVTFLRTTQGIEMTLSLIENPRVRGSVPRLPPVIQGPARFMTGGSLLFLGAGCSEAVDFFWGH